MCVKHAKSQYLEGNPKVPDIVDEIDQLVSEQIASGPVVGAEATCVLCHQDWHGLTGDGISGSLGCPGEFATDDEIRCWRESEGLTLDALKSDLAALRKVVGESHDSTDAVSELQAMLDDMDELPSDEASLNQIIGLIEMAYVRVTKSIARQLNLGMPLFWLPGV